MASGYSNGSGGAITDWSAMEKILSPARPRAHRPGEGHRFLRTPTCVHCGRVQADLIIRGLCPVGVLYVFKGTQGEFSFDKVLKKGRQGAFSFDRARTLAKVGIWKASKGPARTPLRTKSWWRTGAEWGIP